VPSGDLEKSLRDDIERYLTGRLSGLQEELTRLQTQFNEAFGRLLEQTRAAQQPGDEIAVVVSDHLRHARNEGIEAAAAESSVSRQSSDLALVKAAVEELEQQQTQAEVLNVLVNRAAAFAPRVAFFVVRNERATGWRARGLEGTVGDDAVREISLPLSSDNVLSDVARTRSVWSGEPGTRAEDNAIYSHFGGEPPQRMVAVPMVARDKAVAVLYADSAAQDMSAVNLEALETLVRVAAMSVELLAARRGAHAAEHAPAARATEPAREPAHATQGYDAPAAAEPAPHYVSEAPTHAEPEPSHAFAPSPSTFAPEPAASGATAAPEVSPLGASRRYGSRDMDFPVEVPEEEKRYHNEARRFARLLVSEIKLYNEQKVREGRDHADLYDRLREDIDRSRQMYDKRVRPEVAGRYDYFHHELVGMLAEGDESRLGAGYPGATVHAHS
jgi:hypothetical protein